MITSRDIDMADRVHRIGLIPADRLAHLLRRLSETKDEEKTLEGLLVQEGFLTREDVDHIIFGEEDEFLFHGHKIVDTVGRGAFAWVYKAHHPKTGKTVALKVLRKRWFNKLRAVRRMKREAQIGSIIRHPNVVTVFGRNFQPEEAYMIMEYVDGTTLEKLIKRLGALEKSVALSIAIDIAEALTGLDAEHVVHRDIKPANILVSAMGTAKLSDFGVAKRLAVDDGLPRSKLALGTRGYVSPEQVEDARWVDIRSDIFSLGVTLFDMLTGNISSRFMKSKKGKDMISVAPDLRKLEPRLGNGVVEVIGRMTEHDPADRFANPQELVRVLRRLLGEFAILDTSGVQDTVRNCLHKDSTGHLWLESGMPDEIETGEESTITPSTTEDTV